MKTLIEAWNLELTGETITSTTGVVAFTKDAVLKISKVDDEQTALVLNHYNGHGAVKLLRSDGNATLLERVVPGTHLSSIDDNEATHVLCEVIRQLHSNKGLLDLPNIAALQKGFRNVAQIPYELVKQANDIYTDLLSSQDNPVVLHGDLHHDNVLFDDNRGWLAIDPKGYIGEPAYEVGAMLRNPQGVAITPELTMQRVDIIAKQLNLDKERIIKWAFTQAVLAAIWCVEDKQPHEWMLAAAVAFQKL